MSRRLLISSLSVAAALVITGAVVFGLREEAGPPVVRHNLEVLTPTNPWTELPCPAQLNRVAQASAHKRKAQCGRLRVPESEGESRRSLEIGVIRLTPSQDDRNKPLLFLAGGPGDSFSHHLDKRLPVFEELAKSREVLVIDQRGTGQGKPLLQCKREPSSRVLLDSCYREWRADLDPGAFNTTESARDVARVLDHHSIDKVAIYGVSYGTRVALEFAEHFPARTERLLLDSPVAYVDVLAKAARNGQAALERVFEACQNVEICESTFQITFDGMVEIVEEMEKRRPGSGDEFLFGLSKLALHPGVLPYVPYIVERASKGDFELQNELRKGFSTYQSSLGLHLSVQCAEFFAHTTPDVIAQEEMQVLPPFRRAFSTASYQEQCAGWAVPARPFPRAPKELDVPVLVLSGAFDPATPPEYGASVQATLPRSRHVVIHSVAHGAALTPCGALVGRGFMEGGLEAALPDCVENKLKFETGPPDEARLAEIVHQISYRL